MLTPLEIEGTWPPGCFDMPHRAISRILERYTLTLLENNADLLNAIIPPFKNNNAFPLPYSRYTCILILFSNNTPHLHGPLDHTLLLLQSNIPSTSTISLPPPHHLPIFEAEKVTPFT